MADDFDDDAKAGGTADPLAAQIAMAASGAAAEEARAYLREQAELARLQKQNLTEQNAFELSHLRFRRSSDYARFALELAAGFVVLLIVLGLATMVWSASRDRDLVVDAFSVPPDIAQTGMTGAVLAGRVLDRFGAMQSGVLATTQAADSYHSGTGEEVRVQIPDTGISIGELNNYLRDWLGQETHIGGDLVHTKDGLALTLRYGGQPGTTFGGADLDKLVQESAEHLFAVARPLRYGEYLMQNNRIAEADAIIVPQTMKGTGKERALAYADWARLLLNQGRFSDALDKSRQAMQLDSDNPTALGWLQTAEDYLGHDEASRNDADRDIALWHGPDSGMFDPPLVAGAPPAFTAYRDEFDGDFADAVENLKEGAVAEAGWDTAAEQAEDMAQDHDIAAAGEIAAVMPVRQHDGTTSSKPPEVRMLIALARRAWPEAAAAAKVEEAILHTAPYARVILPTFLWPHLAIALARSGDIAGAEALAAKTPMDCDRCVRARGEVAGAKHDWAAAAHWFAIVSARTTHVPFADTDWGEMLLHKGDYDAAIEKFETAHKKGPHFADPLEMWGEALIRENRSDLALAKFAEADKYAPNWGRLHLKWAEALSYTGDKDGARKQFAIASGLDLTQSERAELARAIKING